MMRRIIYILALAIAVTACSQDEGNYDYVDLKEPVITGFSSRRTSEKLTSRKGSMPSSGRCLTAMSWVRQW